MPDGVYFLFLSPNSSSEEQKLKMAIARKNAGLIEPAVEEISVAG